MKPTIRQIILQEIKTLFELKKTERLWHIPVLASLCVGIPMLAGWYFGRLDYGLLACMGGLVILYLNAGTVAERMITLVACSFGFMASYAIGISFSFNPLLSTLFIGAFAMGVHWVTSYFRLPPPNSFFFIMLAAIGSCAPFHLHTIPNRVGLIGMGTMFACTLAFFYSLYITKRIPAKKPAPLVRKEPYSDTVKSLIVGVFAGISILVPQLLQLDNPYWVPISSMAVMQGVDVRHVWQRSFQRILGTFAGMGLTWALLLFHFNALGICIAILVLQFLVEMLIVRHYALTVFFITPMTVFLAEAGSAMTQDPRVLVELRVLDIVIGSLIGAVGGWFLHHRAIQEQTRRRLRITRYVLLNLRHKTRLR
ncbi:FUSC family protein [Chitinophaga horti]|uniref:FUSC family protein n=1 Tax=Chitinophaga horti TaxID=2920382 RepID=A0ABY6J667_9BACT|nr:FUSC family protein [Chitinophaga horti]UYQ95178.1 FUSC family protein [Chitinophaga horti]